MEIVISGICCWVDAASPATGKTVIIRNALNGGSYNGASIPAHYAFIHAKSDQIDETNWTADWRSPDDALFWLTGDRLTIDPVPSGGSIDISMLPHVASDELTDPICPMANEIRPGFRDDPTTEHVLGILDIPANADVSSGTTERGAAFATLRIPGAPVTITATPFADSAGIPRSLRILDPNARLFIVNVDMGAYMTGRGALEDDHKYLVCEIFGSGQSNVASLAAVSPRNAFAQVEIASYATAELCEISGDTVKAIGVAWGRDLYDYLNTLAGGCSASQWP